MFDIIALMGYKYQPLNAERNEIRVLDIFPLAEFKEASINGPAPNTGLEIIRCTLRNVSLNDSTSVFTKLTIRVYNFLLS